MIVKCVWEELLTCFLALAYFDILNSIFIYKSFTAVKDISRDSPNWEISVVQLGEN